MSGDRVWVVEIDLDRNGCFMPTTECGYTREQAELVKQARVQKTLESGDMYPWPMRVVPYVRDLKEGK